MKFSPLFIGSLYLVSKISFTKLQNLLVINEVECGRSQDILENDLSVFIDNELFPLMTYDGSPVDLGQSLTYDMIVPLEPDVQRIFTDDSTCNLYEMISDLFNQLCPFKDNMVSIVSTKPRFVTE